MITIIIIIIKSSSPPFRDSTAYTPITASNRRNAEETEEEFDEDPQQFSHINQRQPSAIHSLLPPVSLCGGCYFQDLLEG